MIFDTKWRIIAEKQLFLHLTLLNINLKDFPFQMQNLWGEY